MMLTDFEFLTPDQKRKKFKTELKQYGYKKVKPVLYRVHTDRLPCNFLENTAFKAMPHITSMLGEYILVWLFDKQSELLLKMIYPHFKRYHKNIKFMQNEQLNNMEKELIRYPDGYTARHSTCDRLLKVVDLYVTRWGHIHTVYECKLPKKEYHQQQRSKNLIRTEHSQHYDIVKETFYYNPNRRQDISKIIGLEHCMNDFKYSLWMEPSDFLHGVDE